MAVHCTGIQLVGGSRHEHIANIRWAQDDSNNAGICTRAQMVVFVERGGVAYVQDMFGNIAVLGVRVNDVGNKYVQTHTDKIWTDNLLALPRL